MYSRSATGSSSAPSVDIWFSLRARTPSAQSVNPLIISTASAQPSACGPSNNHRNNGTPSNRATLKMFGTVKIASLELASATGGGELMELSSLSGPAYDIHMVGTAGFEPTTP
jgi:hypothetical protein